MSENLPGDKFCGECGQELERIRGTRNDIPSIDSERKHVTVLFSDLSGYTAMSDRLDPEDVKSITSRIFGEVAKVIHKYEGFVEKYAGDAVMAIFGVPKAHEDDPIRAILAAREIHRLVKSISYETEKRIEQPLVMHTGINTGLVVTGEINLEKGTHGVAGDTLNVAARLGSAAGADEIIVGQEVYRQAKGHFDFETEVSIQAKGKAEPILAYKVVAPREKPLSFHGLSIIRSELIGRKAEMEELLSAVKELEQGSGSIFSICGEAGTGKSRLVEEFKTALPHDRIQWLEGHAYAYSQNIPYFPLIDLFNRVFHVREEDSPEAVRKKLETGIRGLVEHNEGIVTCIGRLYSLKYPEVEEVSPEFWKAKLREAVKSLLSSLALKAPTVFFLEDIHWADPSFVELLRMTLMDVRQPAIVLCVYRPTFSLFTSHQLRGVEKIYREIRLQDLSSSEAQAMLGSLLQSDQIPSDLKRLVQDKAEGNPFYIEELVNSLVESQTLIREKGDWKLTRQIREADISSTVHGIIAGRLDRLENEAKRLLQEASVIGRSFLYEILKQVTEIKDQCDRWLIGLERLDLIRTKTVQPDLEYIFKHALTQEVVYSGLLKKERQEIHERIGHVMEPLFHERLSEFYETLAYHYKQGRSIHKAVHYLIKSGEKSLGRYALEEAYRNFQEAFDILSNKTDRSDDENTLLITLIVKWAYVYYYKGDFKALTDLLSAHQSLVDDIKDRSVAGMFYGWLGMALWSREEHRESQQQLLRALQIGEQLNDKQVIGYACTWLTWTCAELGHLEDAIKHGTRAQEIAKGFQGDHYLFFKSLGGMGFTYFYSGEGKKALEVGNTLVEFGEKNSDVRCMVMGHYIRGLGHYILGDLSTCVESEERAVQISADPYYRQFPTLFIGMGLFLKGEIQKARAALEEVAAFSEKSGVEEIGTPAKTMLGAVLLAQGELKRGLNTIEGCRRKFEEKGRKWCMGLTELILGQFYLQVATRSGETNLPFILKNLPFLITQFPSAAKKAKQHLLNCIDISEEINAQALAGEAYLNLGLWHKFKGRKEDAKESFSEAIRLFEKGNLEGPLRQAREAIASLE
jgi:class 3 adenylate cyclase/tetratricopeptide (TPR) repeat protein/ABC-type dipeptide/oligopeptide/nickel transport system ATPase component